MWSLLLTFILLLCDQLLREDKFISSMSLNVAVHTLRSAARRAHRKIQLLRQLHTPKTDWRPKQMMSALMVLIHLFSWLPRRLGDDNGPLFVISVSGWRRTWLNKSRRRKPLEFHTLVTHSAILGAVIPPDFCHIAELPVVETLQSCCIV